MSEIIVNTGALYPRYRIDPLAFSGALILAPTLFTLLTFWTIIPIGAFIMGGPVYLVLGTPALLWFLGTRPPKPSEIAVFGFIVHVVACALCVPVIAYLDAADIQGNWWGILPVFGVFGLFFAPIWAGSFGQLYCKFRRDRYSNPV